MFLDIETLLILFFGNNISVLNKYFMCFLRPGVVFGLKNN
jgi:hypothetical protein